MIMTFCSKPALEHLSHTPEDKKVLFCGRHERPLLECYIEKGCSPQILFGADEWQEFYADKEKARKAAVKAASKPQDYSKPSESTEMSFDNNNTFEALKLNNFVPNHVFHQSGMEQPEAQKPQRRKRGSVARATEQDAQNLLEEVKARGMVVVANENNLDPASLSKALKAIGFIPKKGRRT